MNARGFTLVELLVVVGIIGVLASVSLVSISSVRMRARDSKRIQDVRELSKALDLYAISNANYLLQGCGAGSVTKDCVLPADFPMSNFISVSDPIGVTACGTGIKVPCQYSMGLANSTPENYEICFKLESTNATLGVAADNIYHVGPGQSIIPSCEFISQ